MGTVYPKFVVPSARYEESARVLTPHETFNGPQAVFVFNGEGRTFAVVLGIDSYSDWAEQAPELIAKSLPKSRIRQGNSSSTI